MELSAELLNAAGELGSQWGCSAALHPDDHLMTHVVSYSARTVERGPAGGLSEFFESGANDAQQIKDIAAQFGITQSAAVLEFASGYGRVSRHVAPHFSNLICADIHRGAVKFLRKRMGLNAIMSTSKPADFRPGRRFDFIFVLSLFSHLPDYLFGPWLGRLYALLNPGGILMFTTHGEIAAQKQPLLAQNLDRETGFGFLAVSDQVDLDFSVYGSSTALPHYVERRIMIETQNEGRLIDFSPGAWWDVQDQWMIRKPGCLSQSKKTALPAILTRAKDFILGL